MDPESIFFLALFLGHTIGLPFSRCSGWFRFGPFLAFGGFLAFRVRHQKLPVVDGVQGDKHLLVIEEGVDQSSTGFRLELGVAGPWQSGSQTRYK